MQSKWTMTGDRLATTFEPGWAGAILTVDIATIVANGWDLRRDLVVWQVSRNGAHHGHGLSGSVHDAQADALDAWQRARVADPL